MLERDERHEEMVELGLCDLRGGDYCGCEEGFGGSGGDDVGQSGSGCGHNGG